MELVAERQPFAEFEADAALRVGRLETEHVPLDGTAFGEPRPITPRMPYFAMKSKARSEPLWMPIRACGSSLGRLTAGHRA